MKRSAELPESNTRLLEFLQDSRDAIWSVDTDLQLIHFNSSCTNMMEKFYGTTVMFQTNVLQMPDEKSSAEWEEYYNKALMGEYFCVEMKLMDNAEEYYYDICFNPVMINDNLEGVTVFARDITSRKKTERQLSYKVNELNTFMYRATHDLRSPLVSLMGLVHLAKEESGAEKPELSNYFEMIGKSVEKMDKLLVDLVSITNVSQGKLVVNKVDFEKMSADIIESLRHYPNFENITIRKIINENVIFYNDDKLLYSVLQNLIDNAIKYSRNEPGAKPQISIIVECGEQSAVINVIDNGVGIADKSKEKVFDMFYRASAKSAGTGLGLYIVKTAVEKMGGKISLTSVESEGTSVYITLPNFRNNS